MQPATQHKVKAIRFWHPLFVMLCCRLHLIRFSIGTDHDLRFNSAYKRAREFPCISTVCSFWALIGIDFSRCLFFNSALGCARGDACVFCHHVVQVKKIPPKARPHKKKRVALKEHIFGLLQQLDVETQEPQETWHFLVRKGCCILHECWV